jgi:hypothetical protein
MAENRECIQLKTIRVSSRKSWDVPTIFVRAEAIEGDKDHIT